MSKLLSQADFAKSHNVSRNIVTVWKKAGRVIMATDRLVDVDASNAILAQRSRIYRGGTAAGPCAEDVPGEVPERIVKRRRVAQPKPASVEADGEETRSVLIYREATPIAEEALVRLTAAIGPMLAGQMVAAGIPINQTYAAVEMILHEIREVAHDTLDELAVDMGEDGPRFVVPRAEIDWPALAEATGQEFDRTAAEATLAALPFSTDVDHVPLCRRLQAERQS